MDYSFGLTREFVIELSKIKNEPDWMLERRLAAFELYIKTPMPNWGPNLTGLDLKGIKYFTDPNLPETDSWEDLPSEITDVYKKLGIPQAEIEYLGGVGAQYDSGIVYHRIRDSLTKQGVVFENMDTAVQKYPELVQKYFMSDCVPASDHKFTMLHGAVWSGGTFIYVPKAVKVSMPLQAYFRMNAPSSGQFEHTLIIADEDSSLSYIEGCSAPRYTSSSLHAGCVELHVLSGARVQYSSIENWSKNTYNLNTKKALVYDNARVEWLNGNMGSAVTMLYPSSILIGDNAQNESLGIVLAGEGQVQDTGSKVVHIGKNTSSVIRSKSISKDGGVSVYRGFVKISKSAVNATSHVDCDALIVDDVSSSITIPTVIQENNCSTLTHEAKTGRVSSDTLDYIKSRGYNDSEALRLVVGGFAADVIRRLPLEYAVELNKLIDLEIQGN